MSSTSNSAFHPIYTYSLDLDGHIMDWVGDQQTAVSEATPDDYRQKRADAEAGDPEAAFWVYELLRQCRTNPREPWQLERALDSISDSLIERYKDASEIPDGALQHLDRIRQVHELCLEVGDEAGDALAELNWLNLAADLGHMGAQRIYHARAREVLMLQDSLAFRQPGLIEEFKLRCDRYVKALIEAGHPQGYSLMSRILHVGDVYPRDYLMAYAYAHAAELLGQGRIQEEARTRKAGLEHLVSPDQIREAEKIGRELLRDP